MRSFQVAQRLPGFSHHVDSAFQGQRIVLLCVLGDNESDQPAAPKAKRFGNWVRGKPQFTRRVQNLVAGLLERTSVRENTLETADWLTPASLATSWEVARLPVMFRAFECAYDQRPPTEYRDPSSFASGCKI